ncbi:MAG: hypothetical protein HQ511_01640 [Rhodospirillales bacterium]|nr:hypothetical protein [Rhodospirillales bacterium]
MGQYFEPEDSSPVIWIHNKGTEVIKFVISGDSNATNEIRVGSNVLVYDWSSTAYDTVTEVAAMLAAVTNNSDRVVIDVDYKSVVLGSEATDDELIAGTVTINPGDWGAPYLWDTSDTKHFRIYIPPGNKQIPRKGLHIKSAKLNAGGTGGVTVTGYINSTKVYSHSVISPTYMWVDGSTSITNATEAGQLELPLDLYLGKDSGFTLSADRVTTGTTGGALVRVEFE